MPPKLAELFQIDRDISVMRMKLHEAEIIRESILAGILSANVTKQRGYELSKYVKQTKRVPRTEEFVRGFAREIIIQIVDVNLGRADELIGRDRVTSLCEMRPLMAYCVIEKEENE